MFNLPPGAALWRSLGTDNLWTPEAHLLAATVDLLAGANWQRGDGKGPRPKPVERPSDTAEREASAERHAARAAAFLARQKDFGGAS